MRMYEGEARRGACRGTREWRQRHLRRPLSRPRTGRRVRPTYRAPSRRSRQRSPLGRSRLWTERSGRARDRRRHHPPDGWDATFPSGRRRRRHRHGHHACRPRRGPSQQYALSNRALSRARCHDPKFRPCATDRGRERAKTLEAQRPGLDSKIQGRRLSPGGHAELARSPRLVAWGSGNFLGRRDRSVFRPRTCRTFGRPGRSGKTRQPQPALPEGALDRGALRRREPLSRFGCGSQRLAR